MMLRSQHVAAAVLLVSVLFSPVVYADVLSVEIAERVRVEDVSFGETGAYEQIVGTITFGFDPDDPKNAVIVNLDRAPRNAQGLVEATGDLVILTPVDRGRGNGVALVDLSLIHI